jgi:hypothetical protein
MWDRFCSDVKRLIFRELHRDIVIRINREYLTIFEWFHDVYVKTNGKEEHDEGLCIKNEDITFNDRVVDEVFDPSTYGIYHVNVYTKSCERVARLPRRYFYSSLKQYVGRVV